VGGWFGRLKGPAVKSCLQAAGSRLYLNTQSSPMSGLGHQGVATLRDGGESARQWAHEGRARRCKGAKGPLQPATRPLPVLQNPLGATLNFLVMRTDDDIIISIR
jgi:hypothetical protein